MTHQGESISHGGAIANDSRHTHGGITRLREQSPHRPVRDEHIRERSRSPRHDEARPARLAAEPIFERSGLLAKESNSVNGIALKYHEPPEAKKPRHPWRLFVFKDGKEIGTLAKVVLTRF